ncbi:hypothetical protein [Pseudomonas sp. CC6-YY-74]|uniref:hypothetical protein n=1 Tax=Pseudomonas sp. CC6-YY-74 TaxID=1930532 RepID=UPI0009A14031|nr:hypothetical protein [Pseudomonas sp. CC6-YY-74]
MSDQELLKSFKDKFKEFRTIEASLVFGRYKDDSCTKAFSLLRDMELSYAIGAYYACLVIACTSIEACLSHEFGDKGTLGSKLEKAGYTTEANWLREVRNSIVHKNDSSIVQHHFSEEHEQELKELCRKAFVLVHTIYYEPVKNTEPA